LQAANFASDASGLRCSLPGVRSLLALSAACGFTAVALGAFGAHALRQRFEGTLDGARRLEWWHTAANYHLAHALALAVAALVAPRVSSSAATIAGWAFFVGIALFSGSLYAMSLSGVRALGAVTPFGGLAFLVGWASLFWAALKT
jgi:uncharacterized membrane protein YgdD (TMEM256/DUF423 family)